LLERCVDAIAHLDRGVITLYSGNFADFLRIRAERQAQQQAQNVKLISERARIQSFVDRFRAKATKARQAQSRIKMLERMETVAAAHVDSPFHFSFRQPNALPDPLLAIEKASSGYVDRKILDNISLTLRPGCRIACRPRSG